MDKYKRVKKARILQFNAAGDSVGVPHLLKQRPVVPTLPDFNRQWINKNPVVLLDEMVISADNSANNILQKIFSETKMIAAALLIAFSFLAGYFGIYKSQQDKDRELVKRPQEIIRLKYDIIIKGRVLNQKGNELLIETENGSFSINSRAVKNIKYLVVGG